MPLPRLMNHWFVAHDIARDDLSSLRNVHVVSYEWLLTQPDATLADVGTFLGMKAPIQSTLINPDRSSPYANLWQAMLDDGDRGARAAVKRYADAAARYGYDIDDVAKAPQYPLRGSE